MDVCVWWVGQSYEMKFHGYLMKRDQEGRLIPEVNVFQWGQKGIGANRRKRDGWVCHMMFGGSVFGVTEEELFDSKTPFISIRRKQENENVSFQKL